MSIKAFKRIFWIVLDGMGFEHARRCIDTGRFGHLTRVSREGYLGACEPSSPGCQTPSALFALFSGVEPAESGIWGYHMPDPEDPEESMSGFHARPKNARPIWEELGVAGHHYSIMNVAFRADPVWSGRAPGLDFGYDGYRLWRRPGVHRLDGTRQRISHQGLELIVTPTRGGVSIRKGARIRHELRVGDGAVVELSRGARAWAHLPSRALLSLSPLSPALVRGDKEIPGARAEFLDANAFRLSRGSQDITVGSEMAPSNEAMRQKTDLMIEAIRGTPSRLVVAYFPIIDEFNHVYVHDLETAWPDGRVSMLFSACAKLVDECLGRVMGEAGPDDVVAISSDHGAVPYRGMLHLNELLAADGLVRRAGNGYDLARSPAYYHPSDCGLVLTRNVALRRYSAEWSDRGRGADRAAALAGLARALDRARAIYGVDIGMRAEGMTSPNLAFLFPRGIASFTGRPPRRGKPILDREDQGGHHLSPLTPTPWIQAMLGLWSPRGKQLVAAGVPRANRDVSRFLRALLEGEA